jgi:Kef-type K+ transport system membrane component KefB
MLIVTSAVIPIFKRLNLSPILGFLLMGTVLGESTIFCFPLLAKLTSCDHGRLTLLPLSTIHRALLSALD